MDDQLLDRIGRTKLFAKVDFRRLRDELENMKPVRLQPGQVLLDPLRGNHDIFVILCGELLVSREASGATPLARLPAGECAGEISIIDDEPPSAYVLAAVESELLAISQQTLWHMMGLDHTIALNLLRMLTNRFRNNNLVLLESLEMQRRYRDLSETDALTGLHNRTWSNEVFGRQLELCERIGQPVSLALLDIDHFKKVNDQFGHPVGDLVLRHIARLFVQNLRSTDLSARHGGEEFIVLMPATAMVKAHQTVDRLRRKIEEAQIELADGRLLRCTVSIGVAEWRPGLSIEELTNFADIALYRAKELGRNRVCNHGYGQEPAARAE